MPAFVPDTTKIELLRGRLTQFSGMEIEVSYVPEGESLLCLFRTEYELAAFALGNGNPKESYDDSLSKFKKLFVARREQWEKLNVSYVYCLDKRSADVADFCTTIETDAYFCRKFTIAFENIDKELACLPFLPLLKVNTTFVRPPSAQTLLQNNGVSAHLSRYIVQPGRRSGKRLLDDCVNKTFGEPCKIGANVNQTNSTIPSNSRVRAESLKINNFRAYRKDQTFDLDADLILLYGPNGFGKTSFFDAVDFVATGDIGRLNLDGDRFKKAARHLDANVESSLVELKVRCGTETPLFSRNLTDTTHGNISGTRVDRKQILYKLTNRESLGSSDRTDNLVQLFRAAHLFDQERQALTREFRDKCWIPGDLVSRMLAFEDYVAGIEKIREVINLIKKSTKDRKEELAKLEQHSEELNLQLARLQPSIEIALSPQALPSVRQRILSKLSENNVNVNDNEANPISEVREWRATLSSSLANKNTRLESLQSLLHRFLVAEDGAPRVLQARESRASRKEQNEEVSRLFAAHIATHQRLKESIDRLVQEEKDSIKRIESLEWVKQSHQSFKALVEAEAVLSARLRKQNEDFAKARLDHSRNRETYESNAESIRRHGNHVNTLTETANLLSKFEAASFEWRTTEAPRLELTRLLQQAEEDIANRNSRMRDLTRLIERLKIEEEKIAGESANEKVRLTKLEELLAGLDSFVDGPFCPACGTEHDSKEELRSSIALQRFALEQKGGLNEKLTELRVSRNNAEDEANELQTRRQRAEEEKLQLESQQRDFGAKLKSLEELAAKCGVALSDPAFNLKLQNRRTANKEALESEQATIKICHETAEQLQIESSRLLSEIDSLQRSIGEITASMNSVVRQLDAFREEAVKRMITLEHELEEGDLEPLRRKVSQITEDRIKAQSELEINDRNVRQTNARMLQLREELKKLDDEIEEAERSENAINADIAALGLDEDSDRVDLEQKITSEMAGISLLGQIQSEIVSYENALDSLLTSAMASEAQAKIAENKAKSVSLGERDAAEGSWLKMFEGMSDLLSSVQSSAVEAYVREFGPLTSIIQRRLRAVTGFEEVSLHPVQGNIAVRVRRNGEDLPPIDFFSQSQQQILMLSLFFTAFMTQTWSSFSPILLDDPITHFDDLNAYAFLDLICGLIETDVDGRQFILSTCDERLFELAKRRFRNLKHRTKMYRFIGIGSDGPTVETVV